MKVATSCGLASTAATSNFWLEGCCSIGSVIRMLEEISVLAKEGEAGAVLQLATEELEHLHAELAKIESKR